MLHRLAILGVIVAALAGALPVRNAEAHAALVRSDPPVNARLTVSPTSVTAFYSESLDSRLSSMKVLDGRGERVDRGEVTFGPEEAQMSVAVEELGPGFYAVQWETLSTVDGHLLKGSIPFTVLNPDGTEPSGPRPSVEVASGFSITSLRVEDAITKWINLLGAILIVGGLTFALVVAGPASRSVTSPARDDALAARRRHLGWAAWLGLALLAATGVAEALLQVEKLGGFSFLDDALRTGWGEHWIQRQLLLGGMLIVFGAFQLRGASAGRLGEAALWGTLAGGVLYLLVVAVVSHGASIPGSFWAAGADFSHLVAGAVWIGMLLQLALFLAWSRRQSPNGGRDEIVTEHLQRFSPLAATGVVVLLASGTANALSQLPDVESAFDTTYGQVLLVKLALMSSLLFVACVNAFYLRPRITSRAVSAGQSAAATSALLSRLVRVELGLAVVVLLVAAALIQYPTGRQQRDVEANEAAAAEASGFDAVQAAGDIDVQLSVAPNQVGTNSFLVYLFPPASGEPLNVLRVSLRFVPPDPSLGPTVIVAEEAPGNSYKAIGPFFTEPGDWQVSIELRRREVDDASTVFPIVVTGIGPAEEADRFAFPLEAGNWLAAGAVIVVLAAIIVLIWYVQWPRRLRQGQRESG